MVRGSTVLNDIRSKINEVENNVSRADGEISSYEKKITLLSEQREETYSQLAAIYLPALDAEAVKQTLRAVQGEVKEIFRKKQEKRENLESMIQSSREERKDLSKELDDLANQLNQKSKEKEKLEKEVAKVLSADKKYEALHSQAKNADELLKANKARVAEVEEESEKKLPAYENSKMFMYLVKRGFGTKDYSREGVFARLDSWVADIVHFDENKRCYDFLRSMPELMAEEVKRRQYGLDSIVKKLSSVESCVSDDVGLTKVNEQGDGLLKKRAKVIEQISQKDEELKSYSSEREDLDGKKDTYHIQAVQKLKNYLSGQSIAELKERALSTPSPSDDRLVQAIEGIDSKIDEMKAMAKDAKIKRDAISEKLEGLRSVERSFVSRDYDSSRSEFNGFEIDPLLKGYLLGRMDAHAILRDLERSHHLKPRETYHSSSSYDSDSYSSHSSGGGFGGGGFSSGGGFGGGGFSSGSGF